MLSASPDMVELDSLMDLLIGKEDFLKMCPFLFLPSEISPLSQSSKAVIRLFHVVKFLVFVFLLYVK